MPTKQELLDEAREAGVAVPAGATKAEVEALLGGQSAEAPAVSPAAAPEQQAMPVGRYLTDLSAADRRYKMSHWP